MANVLLVAIACGLQIVTTDVGGNKEVICKSELGIMEPFGDYEKLLNAVDQALKEYWDKQNIIEYA
jgi:teichuronic acid biosynthesis glycosyltransferase TuaC